LLICDVEAHGDAFFTGDTREPLDAARANDDPVTMTAERDRCGRADAG
jgi:hypothetical protein